MTKIYAFINATSVGIKVGQTSRQSVEDRVKQQQTGSDRNFVVLGEWDAVTASGEPFTDHDVHRVLKSMGIERLDGEWFGCGIEQVKQAVQTLVQGDRKKNDFGLRFEQQEAVDRTARIYEEAKNSVLEIDPEMSPERRLVLEDNFKVERRFLWNAKMRFGKTFSAYQLAKKVGAQRILVVTYKAVVGDAWREDLEGHQDFEGWKYISVTDEGIQDRESFNKAMMYSGGPVVVFCSYQALHANKERSDAITLYPWDLVVVDEYHFGSWREGARELIGNDIGRKELVDDDAESVEDILSSDHYPFFLYLSGTPFRAIASGEFLEDRIFNWTYSLEQKAKAEWYRAHGVAAPARENPYAGLPKLNLCTYQISDDARLSIEHIGRDQFDLNEFFATLPKEQWPNGRPVFKHEDRVKRWLRILTANFASDTLVAAENGFVESDDLVRDRLKLFPYASDFRINRAVAVRVSPRVALRGLEHTVWYLNSVNQCLAMQDLLRNTPEAGFDRGFDIICAAGTGTDKRIKTNGRTEAYKIDNGIEMVKNRIALAKAASNDSGVRTITLTCGRLMTGVSVPEWSGILMLRNLESPESYFQAAFRVQTPWVERGEIQKHEAFIFDFAPNRALSRMGEYADQVDSLSAEEGKVMRSSEAALEELTEFLPVLAFTGSEFHKIEANQIDAMISYGTTSSMLVQRWESKRLVEVSEYTLARILGNPELMEAIEGMDMFRALGSGSSQENLEGVLNSEVRLKALKKDKRERDANGLKDKAMDKALSDEQRENRRKKNEIKDKLLRFVRRVPAFMYISEERERSLIEVISSHEPEVFELMTGLSKKNFDLLCSSGIFNQEIMNRSIGEFKRVEDVSFLYANLLKP